MADLNRPVREESILEEPRKFTDMINVLTILTFIGSGFALIFQIVYFVGAKKFYDLGMAGQARAQETPSIFRNMQGPDPVGVLQRTYDNRVPIVLLGIIASTLCIIGAVQMRKLKKNGFYIYLIGELLPLLVTFIFVGAAALAGFGVYIAQFFTLLFIILYATQLKYMTK